MSIPPCFLFVLPGGEGTMYVPKKMSPSPPSLDPFPPSPLRSSNALPLWCPVVFKRAVLGLGRPQATGTQPAEAPERPKNQKFLN